MSAQQNFSRPIRMTIWQSNKVILEKDFTTFPVVLGRTSKTEVTLAFEFISRNHAAITEVEGRQLKIVDLNSTNGFYVNGRRVREALLTPDTEIAMGTLRLKVEYVGANDGATVAFSPETQANLAAASTAYKPGLPGQGAAPGAGLKPTPPANLANSIRSAVAAQNPTSNIQNQPTQISQSAPQANSDATAIKPKVVPLKNDRNRPTPPPGGSQATQAAATRVKERPMQGRGGSPAAASALETEPVPQYSDIIHYGLMSLLAPHSQADRLNPHQRVLEGIVSWNDEVYDIQQFWPGERVRIGRGEFSNLNLPLLRNDMSFAVFTGRETRCLVPQGASVSVVRDNETLTMPDLMAANALQNKGGGYVLRMGTTDLVTIDLDGVHKVHFRYAPMPKKLAHKNMISADERFRRTSFLSGFIHFFIIAFALLNAPKSDGPKIPEVQDRIAKILTQPPPPPPPPPKKEEKKIEEIKKEQIKKVVEKKPQPKPKPVKIVEQKPLPKPAKQAANVVGKPSPKPEPVKIESIGVLASLSALPSSNNKSNLPASININKDAGGKPGPQTSGLISSLSVKGGKLPPGGGMGSVKTKGLGYGTGTGYGTQGLAGNAGQRGVSGAVVGTPQLVSVKAEEGLSRNQVMEIVKQHAGEIQACYERSLLSNPGLSGRVEYEWEITPKGSVNWAKVKKSEVAGGDSLNGCVVGVFKKMKFPVAKNGQSTTPNIGFPFGRM